MIIRHGLFTSESVSEGHPDKLADQSARATRAWYSAMRPMRRRNACRCL